MNIVERLDRLRLKRGWTWEELGKELDLSRSMLHYVRMGERQLSARSLHRLGDQEHAAGIETPGVLVESIKKAGLNDQVEIIRVDAHALHDEPAESDVITWRRRALKAEKRLADVLAVLRRLSSANPETALDPATENAAVDFLKGKNS